MIEKRPPSRGDGGTRGGAEKATRRLRHYRPRTLRASRTDDDSERDARHARAQKAAYRAFLASLLNDARRRAREHSKAQW